MKLSTLDAAGRGHLAGIIAAVVAGGMMLGFALPAAAQKSQKEKRIVVEDTRGFLGIHMQELTDEIREGRGMKKSQGGVLVTDVVEESPAAAAGIQEGDVIVKFGRESVESPSQLRRLVRDAKPGDKVNIEYVRNGDTGKTEVAIGDWSESQGFAFVTPDLKDFHFSLPEVADLMRHQRLGVRVTDLNEDLAPYFGVKQGDGLLVLDVYEETTAAALGLKSGDVIKEIAGQEVRSADDIREALSEFEEGDAVKVTVMRNKKNVTLEGEVQKADFRWLTDGGMTFGAMDGPRVKMLKMHGDDEMEALRKELDSLRNELNELKSELKKESRKR